MPEIIDHDGLFKDLVQTYFEEFILLFFPDVYEMIDFTHLNFLDKEIGAGAKRRKKCRVDLIVETKLYDESSLVIIHIESQSSYQKNFNQRMFIYFSRLYERYRKPILPIAIFSYDEPHGEPSTFKIQFPFLNTLNFQYLIIELNKKNWRDFIKQDNPVAGALLSKMGYTNHEKVDVKKAFLRMMVRLQLDPERTEMLTGFFETYLKLDDEEEQRLQTEIGKLDPEEVRIMELISSYRKKGRLEGKIEGKLEGRLEGEIEGKLEGKKDALCTFLESRFNQTAELQRKIQAIADLDELNKVSKEIFAANTLQEIEAILN